MKPIDLAGFEEKFRHDVDPWDYADSRFEARKRSLLLHACGAGRRARVLELACANGETTRRLSAKSLRLLALDGSPTIVREAKRRTADLPNVEIRSAPLPARMPRGPFDLIVISELLYYLSPIDLERLLLRLRAALAPGGRLVSLHHQRRFADAAQPPTLAHRHAILLLTRVLRLTAWQDHGAYRLCVFERPARRRPDVPRADARGGPTRSP